MSLLKKVSLTAAVLLALSACGQGGKPTAANVDELAQQMSITQAGKVTIGAKQVYLTYPKDGQWRTDTLVVGKKGEKSTDSEAVDLGYKLVPVAELKAGELISKIESSGSDCQNPTGSTISTAGGALVQEIECGQKPLRSYVNGQELGPIERWDAASIDAASKVMAAAIGPTTSEMTFQTPKSKSVGKQNSLSEVGLASKNLAGQACRPTAKRNGQVDDTVGLFSWGGCVDDDSKSDSPIDRTKVTGEKVMAALAKASQQLGIAVDDVGSFSVIAKGGQLQLQVYVGSGATAKAETITVALG